MAGGLTVSWQTGALSHVYLEWRVTPADDPDVMSRIVDRPGPTLLQRAAILLVSQLLTLLALVVYTSGGASPVTPVSGSAAGLPPARASVMTVGNGYVVGRHDWTPAQAAIMAAPPA